MTMIAPSEQELLDWAATTNDGQWNELLRLVSVQVEDGAREPTSLGRVAVRLAHRGQEARAGQLLRAVTSVGFIHWRETSLAHPALPSLRSSGAPAEWCEEHSSALDRSEEPAERSTRALACVGMQVLLGRWMEARSACVRLRHKLSKREIVDFLVTRVFRPQVLGLVNAVEDSDEANGQMLGSSPTCTGFSFQAATDQHVDPIVNDRLTNGWRGGRGIGPSRQSRWPDGAF